MPQKVRGGSTGGGASLHHRTRRVPIHLLSDVEAVQKPVRLTGGVRVCVHRRQLQLVHLEPCRQAKAMLGLCGPPPYMGYEARCAL